MENLKKFLAGKAPGFYVSLASFLFALLFLIVYAARGGDSQQLSPVDTTAIVLVVIGLVTNVVVLIKDFGYLAYLPYLFYTITFGVLLNSEMLFLSNVLTAIDNNAIDPLFYVMIVFLVLAIATGFAATIMRIAKKKEVESK